MRQVNKKLLSLLRLMRLHQPAGVWLLLWPGWWAIALAADGLPDARLLALFALGAVIMRGAGCTVNDMIDRRFDARVERTRSRPLASGALTMGEAAAFLFLLLTAALWIALQLRLEALLLAACSLPLVAAYPFMKRITWWPQLFLGLTFNWSALVGWAAARGAVEWPALLLYAGGVFWTLGYDTVYAHQDKEDDRKIGVKSTALRLGESSRAWIAGFYATAALCLALAGAAAGAGWPCFAGALAFALLLARQAWRVDTGDPASCMRAFRGNAHAGWIIFIAIAAARWQAG